MGKTNVLYLCLILLFACQSSFAWRAGFDSQPFPYTEHPESSDKMACMAGYGMFCWRQATGLHDRIGVQALFLTDEEDDSLFLISLDAIGFSQSLADKVRKRLSTATLLPQENIILTATHTHSSIDLQGLWGGLNKQQEKAIIEAIVETARNAWGNVQKVSVHASTSDKLTGYNRRTNNSNIITQVLSLQLRNEQDKPFVTLFTLGSHPVILDKGNKKFSSDWVHYARAELKQKLNVPAMFINGVLGDVLPAHGNPRTFAFAEKYGNDIAKLILNSLDNSKPLKSSLSYCTEVISDQADNYSLVMTTKALQHGTVDWGDPFSRSYKTRTSVIVLDDIVLLTTPGEPVTALGIQLMGLIRYNPVAVLGLTHDSLGYLIPEKNIRTDGDEEKLMISHALSRKVARSLEHLARKCRIRID
ncbi:hypothetical protein GZ77_24395 [Endozoicomonas montiporae]|uniref:Neutral/alkaline non-lysosomal ceramidase N-terminal domain-containing protein n=2 Tax=Endozoicomonas montiporae TaxID=1027273 RepID=A0A081MZN6_9GAMM|nr:neutral/alkaline non-lysosomal ceramidase N-terminal domain-containing protein [Endozoicomonas montiporae]KEQ11659.1 hypothetical protein GZ77_24395 [Endozoicomonas montiporae]